MTSPHSIDQSKPVVGVGACLVGEPVRYNGDHKRRNPHIEKLANHCELQNFCPEMAIGLGVPRQPIRIVEENNGLRLKDSDTQTSDHTDAVNAYADSVITDNNNLCGYIFVKGSPSCGLERVKRYDTNGKVLAADARGLYAQKLVERDPLLPVEEDGRLYDHGLRESFVSRVYLYFDWKLFCQQTITPKGLIDFYSRYKYLIMAHSVPHYKKLGALLGDLKNKDIEELGKETLGLMMEALTKVATPGSHANVLQHLQGYLKQTLSSTEKQELAKLIDQYRQGIVPLITPVTMLQHHFNRAPNHYIDKQTFMAPYPGELALRSIIPAP